MSNIYQPHDKLVRKLLTDKKIVIDLLKNHISGKSLGRLKLSTLRASTETAVSERWKKLHNDVVFHCETRDKKNAYISAHRASVYTRSLDAAAHAPL